ncbi:MAG: hypothetical protein GYA17_22205, partial [Chloroflexi bacterium]|nr:hypothetical protein [Chloroflexota bacterium]
GIFIAATFFTALTFALRAQRAPVVTGKEAIPGRTGIVRRELNPRGIVHVAGEEWSAEIIQGEAPLPEGTRIVVEKVNGLVLQVRRSDPTPNGEELSPR